LLNLIEIEDFGDLTVVAKDGRKFNCHRDIPARRSEVFKRMIISGMKKEGGNVVNKDKESSEV